MSDPFEDRLRGHLAERAGQVRADPDPSALIERSAGRSPRRVPLAGGAVVLAVICAGFGVLTGANLSGGSTAAPSTSASSTNQPGRAGAALAPRTSGPANIPIAGQAPYTFLFTRTASSGVTIRAYASDAGTAGGCTQAAPCPPVVVPGPVQCPKGALCAQPMVTAPPAPSGASGGGGASTGGGSSSSPPTGTPQTTPTQPAGTGGAGSGSTTSVPPQPTAQCGQLVIELSTDKAVGTGTVPRPVGAAPSANTVEILGAGSFGAPEGAPVSWVAVWVGSGVASVHLASGGNVVDAMAPSSGVVVLAVPGSAGLTGSTVVGVDPSGTALATVSADQAPGPDASPLCTTVPPNPSPTPTPTTTTTTVPTTPPGPPTTTPGATVPSTTVPSPANTALPSHAGP
jgi:molecular chaperone DnaK